MRGGRSRTTERQGLVANIQSMLSLQNTHQPTTNLRRSGHWTSSPMTSFRARRSTAAGGGHNRGAAVRLSDVANVIDSRAECPASGYLNGRPAIVIIIYRDRAQHHPDRRTSAPNCRR